MGQVLQAGAGQAPARQALLRAGPRRHDLGHDHQPRLRLGPQVDHVQRRRHPRRRRRRVRRGRHGVDEPGAVPAAQGALRLPAGQRRRWRTRRSSTGCGAAIEDCHMGTHAERVAIKDQVSREDQDAFALDVATAARSPPSTTGRFDAELAPVTVRDAKGRETVVAVDEGPRRDTTAEALAKLGPAFDLPDGEDRGSATIGTVTAGNAPGITDGAAATVVASRAGRRDSSACSRSPGSSATRRPRSRRSGCSSRRSRACAASRRGPSCRSTPTT